MDWGGGEGQYILELEIRKGIDFGGDKRYWKMARKEKYHLGSQNGLPVGNVKKRET